jgi:hypothetical protein
MAEQLKNLYSKGIFMNNISNIVVYNYIELNENPTTEKF